MGRGIVGKCCGEGGGGRGAGGEPLLLPDTQLERETRPNSHTRTLGPSAFRSLRAHLHHFCSQKAILMFFFFLAPQISDQATPVTFSEHSRHFVTLEHTQIECMYMSMLATLPFPSCIPAENTERRGQAC